MLKWALMLAACLLVFPQVDSRSRSVAALQGVDTSVEGARPVAKAMALISRQLGWNITYEDPPYLNADDLLDVTKTPVNGRRAIIPRGGRVRLPDNLAVAATQAGPVALLESILGTEETLRGRVRRFKVLRTGSMLHVVPDAVLDAGLWQPAVSILDATLDCGAHGTLPERSGRVERL